MPGAGGAVGANGKAVTHTDAMDRKLLDQLRHQAAHPNVQHLMTWVANVLAATVTWYPAGEAHVVAPGGGPHVPTDDIQPEVERIASGQARHRDLVVDDVTVSLQAVGMSTPRGVICVARMLPLTDRESDLLSRVADLVALIQESARVAAERRRLDGADIALRMAVFQLLLGGEVPLARRTAAGLVPGALDHDLARVYLLSCGETDVAETLHTVIDSTTLPVLASLCPAQGEHVVVLVGDPDSPQGHVGAAAVDHELHCIVHARRDHHLGASESLPLARVADAYQQASHALSVARHLPERTWSYSGLAPAAAAFGSAGADRWAREYLCPLLELPAAQREDILGSARLMLRLPSVRAASILDLHRNTVAGRMQRTGDLLGLDLGDLHQRAVLDLALQLRHRAAGRTVAEGRSAGSAKLAELLADPGVRAWAESFLAPVFRSGGDLAEVVLSWVRCRGRIEDIAAFLDMHVQTVRRRLRRAGDALQRTLIGGWGNAYDVVIAVAVARPDIITLPDRTAGSPGGP